MKYKKTGRDYLTVKEAAKFVGKSEATIRKLIAKKSIVYIKSNGKIKIGKTDLINYYESIDNGIKRSINTDYQSIELITKTIEILQEQLRAKDEQINELIRAQERSDILIKNFQDKLLLPVSTESINSNKVTTPQKRKRKNLFAILFGW